MARIMRPTHKNPYYRFGDGYSPLTVSDFNVPPRSATGNTSPRPLWESVGKALTRWSRIERELHIIFHVLIQSQTQSSWRALGALISLQSQADVIEATAGQCFQPKNNKNFTAIRNKLNVVRAAVARRNEFAHGQVNKFEGKGYFLVPSQFDWRKTPLGGLPSETMKYFYTSNDIRTMAEKFTLLDKELFNLETDTLAAIHKTYPLTRPPWYGKSRT